MKPRHIGAVSGVLVAVLGGVFGLPEQASAAPKNLQWRTTICQNEQGDKVLGYVDCKAAFTTGGKMYAVKLFPEGGRPPIYYQIGTQGVYPGGECLTVKFHEDYGGVIEHYCTSKTAWELGIKGAPKTTSESPVVSNSRPSCPMVWSDKYRAYEDCKARLRRIYTGNVPFGLERKTCGGPPLEVYKPCR